MRPRRILLILALVWVSSIFDLGFTLAESAQGHFVEMNPIAAHLLGGPAYRLVLYKFALIGTGSLILLWLRRTAAAEWGCWFLLAAHAYLGVRWWMYYECLLDGNEHFLAYVAP